MRGGTDYVGGEILSIWGFRWDCVEISGSDYASELFENDFG